eukprot:scaffold6240_cov14-Tisochrysis_lutea.AAC.1
MAAERKLKGEIDRTLKKVQEGQEVFEGLWVQVCGSTGSIWSMEGHTSLPCLLSLNKKTRLQLPANTFSVGTCVLFYVQVPSPAHVHAGPRLRQQQSARKAGRRAEEGDKEAAAVAGADKSM